MAEVIITPEFRVSQAHVFLPRPPMKGQPVDPTKKLKYEITLLFSLGADLSKLKAAAHAAAVEKFGDKLKDPAFAARIRSPFRDQGEKSFDGYVKGAVFFKAKCDTRPGLVDHNVQTIIEESQFYSGCYAIASVHFYGYDNVSCGVGCDLHNIQKLRDGEPLGGRTRPEDDFKPAAKPAGTADASATNLFA